MWYMEKSEFQQMFVKEHKIHGSGLQKCLDSSPAHPPLIASGLSQWTSQ